MDSAATRAEWNRPARLTAWALVIAGVVLRTMRYLAEDLPLRIDEVRLYLNVAERSFAGLARPLDYDQGAPVGFLWLLEVASGAFGESDLALRLVAYLAGIATPFLLLAVARRSLGAVGGLSALALLAVASQLVARSGDLKQYTLDACVSVAIVAAALPLLRAEASRARALVFGAVGSLAVFLSHPSVFVLAGVGAALLVDAFLRRDRTRLVVLSGSVVAWLAVFGTLYALTYGDLATSPVMISYWSSSFMPPPTSSEFLRWCVRAWRELCLAVRLESHVIAAVLALMGWFTLARSNWRVLVFVLAPIVLAALASAFGKYPFSDRMLTYAVPLLVLALGAGVEFAFAALRRVGRWAAPLALVPLLVLLGPAAQRSLDPPRWMIGRVDVPTLLEQLALQREDGDAIVVEGGLIYPFDHYARTLLPGMERLPELLGRSGEVAEDAFDALGGRRRVWFALHDRMRIGGQPPRDYRPLLLAALDGRGRRVVTLRAPNVSAYLYEFEP